MNLDVISNRLAILAACEHVRTSQEECPWVVLGYSESSPHPCIYTVDIRACGTTWKDFLLALPVDKILYAYLKLDAAIVDRSFRPQTNFLLIFMLWTGGSVSSNEKSMCSRHTDKMSELIGGNDCILVCSSVLDILTNIDVLECKDSFLRYKASRVTAGRGSKGNLLPSERALMSVNILGDICCGKSAFVGFIKSGLFNHGLGSTTGQQLSLTNWDNKHIKFRLNIFDNSGLDIRFPSLTYMCLIKRTNGIILFYDITQRKSFLNIRERMVLIRKNTSPSICIMLLGNKLDLKDKREVTSEEGDELSRELGINIFFEISVKNGTNVLDAWNAFNLLLGINFNEDITNRQSNDTVDIRSTRQRQSCCK